MEDKISKQMENMDERLVNQMYLEKTYVKVYLEDVQRDVGVMIELMEQVGVSSREEVEEIRVEVKDKIEEITSVLRM